jgi:hypothetical protein
VTAEPISPELVLVWPELAERVRASLPRIQLYEDTLLLRRAATGTAAVRARSSQPERLFLTVVVAAAAAVVASLLLQERSQGSHDALLVPAPATSSVERRTAAPVARPETLRAARPRTSPASDDRVRKPARRPVPVVLGVIATAGDGYVRLQWQRPPGVERVAVLRGNRRRTVEQYRGGRQTFVEKGLRNGVQYRYVLVSYDRWGRSSEGVITVIRPRGSSPSPDEGR